MNRGGFSWRRLVGISAAKARISRWIGIPLTRSGRERKLGRLVYRLAIWLVLLTVVGAWLMARGACRSS